MINIKARLFILNPKEILGTYIVIDNIIPANSKINGNT